MSGFGLRAGFGQELRSSFDGPERITNFMRETRCHLPENRQSITLFHTLIQPRGLNDDSTLCRQRIEKCNLFRGKRVANAIVGHDEQPNDFVVLCPDG